MTAMECQRNYEGRTLVITKETNFDSIEPNFDTINGQYDVVKISNVTIDDAFAKQLIQNELNYDLIKLEIDGSAFSSRILRKILDPSILDLVITNCELHIRDIYVVMDVLNGSGNHIVDLSKSKIAWDEGLGILDRVGPPPMYQDYKVGTLYFDGREITTVNKECLKNKCLGWDVRFVN